LGLSDEELEESLANLQAMADAVGCSMQVKHRRQGEQGLTARVVMLRQTSSSPSHLHIAVCGEFDSGKSTLISVLVTGKLCNGNGMARNRIVRYNHELETGRTSSISHHSVCFSDEGEILSNSGARVRALSELEIAEQTHKVIVFQDLAGHEKYFKTALHGFLGREPDVCLLAVSCKRGVQSMTREYLGVAVALKVRLCIVVTKMDAAADGDVDGLVSEVSRLLTAAGRTPVLVTDEQQAWGGGSDLLTVPMFQVSSVSGSGLERLKSYLFKLPSEQKRWDQLKLQETEVRVLEQYRVEEEDDDCLSDDDGSLQAHKHRRRSFERDGGDATIVLGMIKSGTVSVDDVLLCGPNKAGDFVPVSVGSVHINRVPVRAATAGQCATLLLRRTRGPEPVEECAEAVLGSSRCSFEALTSVESGSSAEVVHGSPVKDDDDWTEEDNSVVTEIWAKRVGMVLVAQQAKPVASWRFVAELLVLNHPSVIRVNYEPVVHAENVMQSARITGIECVSRKNITSDADAADGLTVGDKAICVFRFLYQPEFILAGTAIVIREGRTRGVGRVLRAIP
jgi:GTPase